MLDTQDILWINNNVREDGGDKFQFDLNVGHSIEDEILLTIKKKYPLCYKIKGYFKGYDIYCPETSMGIEVKSDQKSQYTGNVLLEIEFDGKPSALSTTTATYWVFILDKENIVWIKPSDIKKLITEQNLQKRTFTSKGDTKKKTAYFLPVEILKTSKYSSLKKR